MATGAEVAAIARKWDGVEFNHGQVEQCANFVRHVLGKVGIDPAPAARPDDGYPTSKSLADSFAGDDVGQKISDPLKLEAGDVVLFQNTYGDWPRGTITHVGIYVGLGQVVDRPTASEPVRLTTLGHFGSCFKEGRRLHAYAS